MAMKNYLKSAKIKTSNIKNSNLSIYDAIEIGDTKLWLTSAELSALLNDQLIGKSLHGLPNRTISRVAKNMVCEILQFPIPKSFKRVRPKFSALKFDVYVQKSNNLQIWNEGLDGERRYVLIRVDEYGIITKVKVVTGSDLAFLDTTGTLTQKYQARLKIGDKKTEMISKNDTDLLSSIIRSEGILEDLSNFSPVDEPTRKSLLPIKTIFKKIAPLIGKSFLDTGHDQERNRGGEVHKLVCLALGYKKFSDNGKFPDIKHQLLEVKLQTSPTIDLGLVSPDSISNLDIEKIKDTNIRHCDIRYAIFYGDIVNRYVTIKNIFLVSGKDFYQRFPQFGGKVINRKIQIPLPRFFFNV